MVGKNSIKIEGYQVKALSNKKIKSGGILAAVRKDTDIELIVTHNNPDKQQLWVQANTKDDKYRLGIMYGYPSEQGLDSEEIEDWFISLEEEYSKNSEIDTMILGDFNAHTGMDNLPINKNGKLLNNLIQRRDLNMINKESICTGHITREDPNGTKSVIDYVLANTGMISRINKMIIDDQHNYKISRYIKRNGVSKEIPIDHNIITIDVHSYPKKKSDKITKWDFKNKENLKKFQQLTGKTKFKEKWDEKRNIDTKYNTWLRQIKSLMYQTLKRITVKHQPKYKETRYLIRKKSKLYRLIKKAKMIRKDGVIINSLE